MYEFTDQAKMKVHFVSLLFLATLPASTCFKRSIQTEYYSDVILPCDDEPESREMTSKEELLYPIKKYWLLPNGLLVDTYVDDRIKIARNFSLRIDNAVASDYGVYYCLLVWGEGEVTLYDVAFNINGPDYERLHERMRYNVVVGVITAVVVFALVLVGCGAWHVRHSHAKRHEERRNSSKSGSQINNKSGLQIECHDNHGSIFKNERL